MHISIYVLLFFALAFTIAFIYSEKFRKIATENYISLIIIGVLFRLAATTVDVYYDIDVNTFKAWSQIVFSEGFTNFYSQDSFSDYPPGYMYILYIIGAIQSIFNIDMNSNLFTLIIKTPAIIFDILIGVFIYKIAKTRMIPIYAWFISLAFMLNPAVIMDSSIWGQVDSVYTFFMVLSIYYIADKKYFKGFMVYAISILIKPQALIIAPIYIYATYEILEANDFGLKGFKQVGFYALSCLILFICGILPFTQNFDFSPIFAQYGETLSSYPYATLNAYNFWALVGANWKDVTETFFFFSYKVWGVIFIDITVIISLFLLNKTRTKSNFFFVAGLLNTMTFMFSTKMHERYLFASIVFFLIAFIYKSDKKLLVLFTGFSITFFINCRDVLIYLVHGNDLTYLHHLRFMSFLNINLTMFMLAIAFFCYKKDEMDEPLVNLGTPPEENINLGTPPEENINLGTPPEENINLGTPPEKNINLGTPPEENINLSTPPEENINLGTLPEENINLGMSPEEDINIGMSPEEDINIGTPPEENINLGTPPEKNTNPIGKMIKKDYILVSVLMVVYAVIAFTNLGNMESPQSIWDARVVQEEISSEPREKPVAIIDFGQPQKITEMQAMLGPREGQKFTISSSDDGVNWQTYPEFEINSVFAWESFPMEIETRYIKLEAVTDELMLNEIAFKNEGQIITPVQVSAGAEPLFDEQELVPDRKDYMNSTYFDEIYHPRTAYEFVHHMDVYETTHPPLGKVMMSWGVMMFGMSPFGWRFMGTLVGVLMIFVIYAFAKKMFNKTGIAFFASVLLTFDFMHFSQTRLATIDTYVTFFIMCMYYFMYCYYKESFYDTKLKKTLIYLGLSGMFMGLAIASKWQGVYGAVGLAIIFFYVIYKRYQEYIYAKNNPDYENSEYITDNFQKYTTITIFSCFAFFVAIPLVIYGLSYIPYLQTPNQDGIKSIIASQQYMFNYHSDLVSTHPFESAWWTWPVDARPIFYFAEDLGNGVKQGISSFGNPLVWWGGIVGILFCLIRMYKDKDNKIIGFMLGALCIQFLLFIIISSNEYVKPYMMVIPVIVAVVGYGLLKLDKGNDKSLVVFLLIAFGSQYLPWTLVSRTTYIYHYFPSVPFIALIVAYMFYELFEHKNVYIKYIFAAAVIILFVMFYPVLSGMPVSEEYVRRFLTWFPSWQLV